MKKIIFFITGLFFCNMSYADEICLKKSGFPGPEFVASVRYDVLTSGRIKLNILVEGVSGPYEALLEIFYGVPKDFLWSIEQMYKGQYELSSMVAMDVIEDQREAGIYVSEKFSNIALHLELHPVSHGDTPFCPENFQILIPKGSLDLKVKRGTVGRFQCLE